MESNNIPKILAPTSLGVTTSTEVTLKAPTTLETVSLSPPSRVAAAEEHMAWTFYPSPKRFIIITKNFKEKFSFDLPSPFSPTPFSGSDIPHILVRYAFVRSNDRSVMEM